MVSFLNGIGAGEADVIVQDMLDRDAGCFEAHVDPNCQRNDGPWYWDESNQTSPNFHEYLEWAKAISDGLGKPILWWQVPFGVPSATPGGDAGRYRDNRVHYVFSHVAEFVAAGGLGITFGVGAGNQTYITTDGGQFRNAVTPTSPRRSRCRSGRPAHAEARASRAASCWRPAGQSPRPDAALTWPSAPASTKAAPQAAANARARASVT